MPSPTLAARIRFANAEARVYVDTFPGRPTRETYENVVDRMRGDITDRTLRGGSLTCDHDASQQRSWVLWVPWAKPHLFRCPMCFSEILRDGPPEDADGCDGCGETLEDPGLPAMDLLPGRLTRRETVQPPVILLLALCSSCIEGDR